MLPRSESIMIIEVVAPAGWQPHNSARRARRGAEEGKVEGRGWTYRIGV